LKLEKLRALQEKQLLELAKQNQLLTDEDINTIETNEKSAFELINKRLTDDLKSNNGRHTQNFLQSDDLLGHDFTFDASGIIKQLGLSGLKDEDKIKMFERINSMRTTLAEKIWEKTKQTTKTGSGLGLMIMMLLMQVSQEQGSGH
jgi:hypothetical protein